MAKEGVHRINRLRQKWIGYRLLADVMLAAACALMAFNVWFLINKITYMFIPPVWWLLPTGILLFGIIIALNKPWKLTTASVITFLNQTYPGLEESAELTLKAPHDLNTLQLLQLNKVEEAMQHIPSTPKRFVGKLKRSSIVLAVAIIITFLMGFVTVNGYVTGDNILIPPPDKAAFEKILSQIKSVQLIIISPDYTKKPRREQDRFNLLAEEGASISWKIHTNVAVKQISLRFDDSETISLKPDNDNTKWTVSKAINKPGYYQVIIDGKVSDLYQIEIIKDTPPLIHVTTPKPETYIDAGEPPKVKLTTIITDDYGISDALIYATVAKGSGEGVKFKTYQLPFDQFLQDHKSRYDLQYLFDLPKLNMEPGDELYFYVEAQDNHQQKSRTDVFKISIQDTAALLSMNGLVNGSSLKPEFFRSERQIIMDTEQLLKQKDSLSKDKFNALSGNIGLDQKLLRLRYGKFLGEEDESSVGGVGENDELAKVENFNNANMIVDAMTDKHDNAEDATYLEANIKQQLKATLTEMWNAELHLRLYKPQEALPFEYKALRLLKDLQQKSRVYVAKTAYNPTPFKMEKRLTGELDKIGQPINKQTIKPVIDNFAALNKAIQILDQLKLTRRYNVADQQILQQAKLQLSVRASSQPGLYLTAVNALNRAISSKRIDIQDVNKIEKAIQQLLPAIGKIPQNQTITPDGGLAQQYYKNLKTAFK